MQDIIGIDISKDRLNAHRLSDQSHQPFTNDDTGYRNLIRWVGPDVKVVFEPTGVYHLHLEMALASRGIPSVIILPMIGCVRNKLRKSHPDLSVFRGYQTSSRRTRHERIIDIPPSGSRFFPWSISGSPQAGIGRSGGQANSRLRGRRTRCGQESLRAHPNPRPLGGHLSAAAELSAYVSQHPCG